MQTITYRACESLIQQEKYQSKEEMQDKLDVFYAGNRLSKEEYEFLTSLLGEQA